MCVTFTLYISISKKQTSNFFTNTFKRTKLWLYRALFSLIVHRGLLSVQSLTLRALATCWTKLELETFFCVFFGGLAKAVFFLQLFILQVQMVYKRQRTYGNKLVQRDTSSKRNYFELYKPHSQRGQTSGTLLLLLLLLFLLLLLLLLLLCNIVAQRKGVFSLFLFMN